MENGDKTLDGLYMIKNANDTIRNKARGFLLDILDNAVVHNTTDETVGGVKTFTDGIILGVIDHAYGGFQDEAETLSLDADTWTHITNAGNNLWTLAEGDGFTMVDDELIVTRHADYNGILTLTITGGNSKDFKFRVYNITKSEVMGYHIGASTTVSNYTNISVPIYVEANAGDHLQFQAWCLAGDDPTFRSAIFTIQYLHD